MTTSDDLLEGIGEAADIVDGLIAAEALPIPPALAAEGRTGALASLRDRLRALYVAHADNNPLEMHP